ncbi:MAG: four helix bundle protein [Acidobacteriota bacterium]
MEGIRYKFQDLLIYQKALDYVDQVYKITQSWPKQEEFNLISQARRAATSAVLNIAEGSTGQSDLEQSRFLGLALRSYLETIATLDMAQRRGYLQPEESQLWRTSGHELFVKIQALRSSLRERSRGGSAYGVRDEESSG